MKAYGVQRRCRRVSGTAGSVRSAGCGKGIILSVLDRLSSRQGERSSRPNRIVAAECIETPELLQEIAEGMTTTNAALIADCAEVLTLVSDEHPDLVAPYACGLIPLLRHAKPRVRWEAVHALAHIAHAVPECLHEQVPVLATTIRSDTSTIVRDYAVDAVANYAGTSRSAAEEAFPVLKETLDLWNGKHTAHALAGFQKAAVMMPEKTSTFEDIGNRYLNHSRSVIRRAARRLLRSMIDEDDG